MPPSPTALSLGNRAEQAGQHAQAVRHYALGLADESSHGNSPLAAQLAANLARARRGYRRQRANGYQSGNQSSPQPNSQLQVAVACWSLSENPAGRALTLASLYQDLAEQPGGGIEQVALIGSLFARRGRSLWAPIHAYLNQSAIPVHSIVIDDDRQFMTQAVDLVSAHPVDLLHLAKPRFPNILFGLLYKLLWDARVLVDIDDDELAFTEAEPLCDSDEQSAGSVLEQWLRRYNGLPPWQDLPGRPWTELGMSLCHAFDGLSVVNRALQQRHGGTLIRHARDPRQFQPSAERRARARVRWRIQPAQRVVIFLGTPRRHKGLLETAQALASLNQSNLLFLIAGRFSSADGALRDALQAEQKRGRIAIRFLDDQPFAAIPDLLAAADFAIFLQDPDSAAARAQTPAKLSDALAMGLTVFAEPTPGLADLQEQGAFIPVTRATLAERLRVHLAASAPQPASPQPHPVFSRELSLQANRRRLQTLLAGMPSPSRTATQIGSAPADDGSATVLLERLCALPMLGPLPRALQQAKPTHCQGISVIILSLNGADLLERLLASFLATNSHQPVELIIVDHSKLDDPTDRTAAVIASHRANAHRQAQAKAQAASKHRRTGTSTTAIWHLRRGRNDSFSNSCNLAAALASYPHLLFLNNDICYTADALPPALQALQQPAVGAVGIRLDDDPDRLPTGRTPSVQHLGIEFVWSAERGYHQPRQISHPDAYALSTNSPSGRTAAPPAGLPSRQARTPALTPSGTATNGQPRPAVTGAFLLCSKQDFEQLGGFCTDYDYGLEDIDFCLRLGRDLGKTSYCLTTLSLQHSHMSTRNRDPQGTAARIQANHRSFKARWAAHTRSLTQASSA